MDETDVTLMLELEEKITQRIRKELFSVMSLYPTTAPINITTEEARNAVSAFAINAILNNPWAITELTKKIGAKMSNVNY